MAGTLPSNSTSTTGPMIWMTRPTFSAAMNSFLCSGPGDHFYDLLRDRGLTDLVHVEREPVDHLPRIVGGGVHGRHARAVLGRRRLEQRPPDLYLDVLRQDPVEDPSRRGLVDVVQRWLRRIELQLPDGQELLDHHLLRDHGLELVVDDVDAVHLALHVALDERLRDALRGRELQGLEQPDVLGADAVSPAAEEVAALAPHEVQLQLALAALLLVEEACGRADDVRVEA